MKWILKRLRSTMRWTFWSVVGALGSLLVALVIILLTGVLVPLFALFILLFGLFSIIMAWLTGKTFAETLGLKVIDSAMQQMEQVDIHERNGQWKAVYDLLKRLRNHV